MRLTTHDRAWYERRLDGWGGSEAPALLGVSRWRTAREEVERKARRIIPDPDAPERLRLRLGRDMEPILLEHLYESLLERHGEAPRPWRPREDRIFRSRVWPFMTAHPDGFIGPALAELKTDEYGYEAWGDEDDEDWTRAVPRFYGVQVQHSLAVTKRPCGWLFVQIGYHEQRLYRIERDDAFIADLADVEGEEWDRVVAIRARLAEGPDAEIEDLLPPLTGAALAQDIKRRHPEGNGELLPATAEQEALIARLRDARLARRQAEAEEAALEVRIQDAIRAYDGISSAVGTITWRKSKDGSELDRRAVIADLRELLTGRGISELELDAIEEYHRRPKPGTRSFLVPRSWDKPVQPAA